MLAVPGPGNRHRQRPKLSCISICELVLIAQFIKTGFFKNPNPAVLRVLLGLRDFCYLNERRCDSNLSPIFVPCLTFIYH